MLFPIKNVEYLQKIDEAVSLKNQVQEVRLQDKLGDQNCLENAKNVFKLMTDATKNTSEIITKTLTKKSINNNKAIEILNEKVLELMNEKGMITPYKASSLVNLFKPENKSQFRLIKDQTSIRLNDFLINGGIPVSLCSKMLTFRDSNKSFKIDEDLLEAITNYDFNVDHSNPQDQNLIYEFGKKMKFDIMQTGRKSNRDKFMIKLQKIT